MAFTLTAEPRPMGHHKHGAEKDWKAGLGTSKGDKRVVWSVHLPLAMFSTVLLQGVPFQERCCVVGE